MNALSPILSVAPEIGRWAYQCQCQCQGQGHVSHERCQRIHRQFSRIDYERATHPSSIFDCAIYNTACRVGNSFIRSFIRSFNSWPQCFGPKGMNHSNVCQRLHVLWCIVYRAPDLTARGRSTRRWTKCRKSVSLRARIPRSKSL
jgi:hypothetical protein